MTELLKKKCDDPTLKKETQEIFNSYVSVQEAVKSVGVNRPLRLSSILSSFVKASQFRHQTNLEKLSQLQKKVTPSTKHISKLSITSGFDSFKLHARKGASHSPCVNKKKEIIRSSSKPSLVVKPDEQSTANPEDFESDLNSVNKLTSPSLKARRLTKPEIFNSISNLLLVPKLKTEMEVTPKDTSMEEGTFQFDENDAVELNKTMNLFDQPSGEKPLKATTECTEAFSPDRKEKSQFFNGDKAGEQCLTIGESQRLRTSASVSAIVPMKDNLRRVRSKLSVDIIPNRKFRSSQCTPINSRSITPVKQSIAEFPSPARLLKLSSLLQLEKKPALTSEKPEVKKNFMKKIFEELLESNSSIQRSRNSYYQAYNTKFPSKVINAKGSRQGDFGVDSINGLEKKPLLAVGQKSFEGTKASEAYKKDINQGPILANSMGFARSRPSALQIKVSNKCQELNIPQTNSATIQYSSISQPASPAEFRSIRSKQVLRKLNEVPKVSEKNFRFSGVRVRPVIVNLDVSSIHFPDQIRSTKQQDQSMEGVPAQNVSTLISESISRLFPSQLQKAPQEFLSTKNQSHETKYTAEEMNISGPHRSILRPPQITASKQLKIFDTFSKMNQRAQRAPMLSRRTTTANLKELY